MNIMLIMPQLGMVEQETNEEQWEMLEAVTELFSVSYFQFEHMFYSKLNYGLKVLYTRLRWLLSMVLV